MRGGCALRSLPPFERLLNIVALFGHAIVKQLLSPGGGEHAKPSHEWQRNSYRLQFQSVAESDDTYSCAARGQTEQALLR